MEPATAAIFVAAPDGRPRAPAEALALLYDLTPAETRVLQLLSEGLTQKEIGERVGVAPSTLKTHMISLFNRTGFRRRVDLIRLVADLASPT